MQLLIRPALATDAPAMAALGHDLGFRGSEQDFQGNLQDAIADPAVSVYAAESEQAIVIGWAAAERRIFVQSGRVLEITALVVAPDVRGQGVGRALMAAIESDALSVGLSVVRLRSSVVRTGPHGFYKSLGYEVQKTQHCFIKRLRA